MTTNELIEVTVFCQFYQVEDSFVNMLEENGILKFQLIDERKFIHHDQLQDLEKLVRLSQDLDVNSSGIAVISEMLRRMEKMQDEIRGLKNKLRFYEKAD